MTPFLQLYLELSEIKSRIEKTLEQNEIPIRAEIDKAFKHNSLDRHAMQLTFTQDLPRKALPKHRSKNK